MIENAILKALGGLSGLPVYPLLLPDPVQQGITFQRISDPEVGGGFVRTGLIAGRFQISIYKVNDYTAVVELDRAIWEAWRDIRHGKIADYPVQYVERGGSGLTGKLRYSVQYRRVRDYIIYYSEDAS